MTAFSVSRAMPHPSPSPAGRVPEGLCAPGWNQQGLRCDIALCLHPTSAPGWLCGFGQQPELWGLSFLPVKWGQ